MHLLLFGPNNHFYQLYQFKYSDISQELFEVKCEYIVEVPRGEEKEEGGRKIHLIYFKGSLKFLFI